MTEEKRELQVYTSQKPVLVPDHELSDPFLVPYTEIKSYQGFSKSFVRSQNRKIEKVFAGQEDSGTKKIEVEEVTGYNWLDTVSPPFNMFYLAKLYEVSPAHHSAVNAKVDNIVGLGFDWKESPKTKAQKSKLKSERSLKTLENALADGRDALTEWLENINQEDTIDEWLRKVWRDYESTGNGYIEIGRTSTGAIGYIGHVPAGNMRVRVHRDGFVQIVGNRVVFFRNFGDTSTPNSVTNDSNPNEIIHFKKYTPTNNFYGVPDIIPAKTALAGNEFAARYNLDFFENKAVPRYIIIAKGGANLSQVAQRKLVEFFETGLRGQHHRSIFVPLPSDEDVELTFQAVESGSQDSSFGEYRQANNEEIFMSHRTPMTRAGVFGNTGLAASKDADKVFKESVCAPEQRILEKKLGRVFKEVTDMFVFTLNELTLTDEEQLAGINEKYIRNGVLVPDEVREDMKRGPRPDGKGMEPTVLTAQQQADQKATALQSRERDTNRATNSPDSSNSPKSRNAQGDGRQQA